MRNPATQSRPTLVALVLLVFALATAFVVAPRTLAGGTYADRDGIVRAARTGFLDYWGSGERRLPASLETVVDFWLRYHLAKAAIASALLGVLVVLGMSLWRAYLRRGGLVLATAGSAVTTLALASVALVMANVQGAFAPFASLLPMLTSGASDAPLAASLGQAREQLASSLSTGSARPPALETMVTDFADYHSALAVVGALVAIVLIGLSVVSWRGFAAAGDRRAKQLMAVFGVASTLAALAVIAIVAANTGTAANPAPALLAFFDGGW